MAKSVTPKEFSLVAACCRWPLADDACAEIRRNALGTLDWDYVVRIAARHRVSGLLHNALQTAGVAVPEAAWQKLTRRRQEIVRQNLLSTAEGLHLQRRFEESGVRVLTIKGMPLSVRAYGSIGIKQSRDIDLLVEPASVAAALRLLESEGYVLIDPAEKLGDWQREAYIARGYEIEMVRPRDGLQLELHWRLTENPLLLREWQFGRPDCKVPVPGGSLLTLPDEDVFCYLAVHGATHCWFRLKWLADFNAITADLESAELLRLYRRADSVGAGRSAAQGLLLCHALLGRALPPALAEALRCERGVNYLVRRAIRAMLTPDPAVEPPQNLAQTVQNVVDLFLAGKGFVFLRAQCALTLVGPHDVIAFRLPAALRFLYPVLRVPLWLWRRAASRRRPLLRAA